jgi:predicted DsbA family dithiol-disulfide isomerase
MRTSCPFSALVFVIALSLPDAGHAAPADEPLAEVDGEAITAAEIEQALGARLHQLEQQIYEMKRQKLKVVIGERLLALEAARQGLSVEALLDAEVTAKAGTVSDEEVESFYRANKAGMKGDEAEVRERIRAYFKSQKLVARRYAYMQSLRSQATVVVHLKEPPAFRAEVGVEGAPFRGPATAPVTIVEFSDFHCPSCKQVVSTLTQVLSRYHETVRLIYRDFPIDGFHPQARKAAEAARCAHDQGKFWEYHDALFANAPQAGPEQLKRYAQQVGLDFPSFERCLASGTHAATVQKSVEEAIRLGVTGTPAFFINGELLSGAQPLEGFTRVIERELARTR